jgi:diaminopimelate decarboxylase
MNAAPRILVSGLYSGPNPSPGVGVVRSLREAFPHADLVGVDYSPRSTGLHWPEMDRVWVARPWSELNLAEHQRQVQGELREDGIWISGLDLEVQWLANTRAQNPRILVPSTEALNAIRKPPTLPDSLAIATPDYLSLDAPDNSLFRFCRQHDWRIWVKGPYYEARFVSDWRQLQAARGELQETWGAGAGLFAQAHVAGHEVSILLCAFSGRLIDAVMMTKREVTAEGKTWAGAIAELPVALSAALADFVAAIGWHGAAEVEMVVDAAGRRWIIEWNPRFPAWVYGATLAGRNLPAKLVTAVTGLVPETSKLARSTQFVRVVLEIPTRRDHSLPDIPEDGPNPGQSAKHPSGMPELARRLGNTSSRLELSPPIHQGDEDPDAVPGWGPEMEPAATPCRLFLPEVARRAITAAADAANCASRPALGVRIALSIKTDPRPEILEMAREHGLMLEAISQFEVSAALRAGVEAHDVILNGPAKWWPTPSSPGSFKGIFFDSLNEAAMYLGASPWGGPWAGVIGPRLRLPGTNSRFGIDVGDPEVFGRLVDILTDLKDRQDIGVQFHFASSAAGLPGWLHLFSASLAWCSLLTELVGPVTWLDVGGGYDPEDWNDEILGWLTEAAQTAAARVPSLRQLVLEPGKALTQRTSVLLSRVVDVRRREGTVDVVADASIAELPHATAFPRKALRLQDGAWISLVPGAGTILGRLCMENDILGRNLHLADLRVGDLLCFTDAGAYDRSMAYEFGRA